MIDQMRRPTKPKGSRDYDEVREGKSEAVDETKRRSWRGPIGRILRGQSVAGDDDAGFPSRRFLRPGFPLAVLCLRFSFSCSLSGAQILSCLVAHRGPTVVLSSSRRGSSEGLVAEYGKMKEEGGKGKGG